MRSWPCPCQTPQRHPVGAARQLWVMHGTSIVEVDPREVWTSVGGAVTTASAESQLVSSRRSSNSARDLPEHVSAGRDAEFPRGAVEFRPGRRVLFERGKS